MRDLSAEIEAALGRRIKIQNLLLSAREAGAVLDRSGAYQFYADIPKKDLARLTLNLITDDRVFPPVLLDEGDQLLDGHQRVQAFLARAKRETAKKTKLPARRLLGLQKEEKIWLVRSLNDNRRHLSRAGRRSSIVQCLQRFTEEGLNPSDRLLGSLLAVDHKTVAKCREYLDGGRSEGKGRRVGADGIARKSPAAKHTAWKLLSGEYADFQPAGRLWLVIDDICGSIPSGGGYLHALARLGEWLLDRRRGLFLLFARPDQIGEAVSSFSHFELRWQWPMLMPDELVDSPPGNFHPASRSLLLFSCGEFIKRLNEIDDVFDLRRQSGKTEEKLRDIVLERLLAGKLMTPHIHDRCTSPAEQRRWVQKHHFVMYDRQGAKLDGAGERPK